MRGGRPGTRQGSHLQVPRPLGIAGRDEAGAGTQRSVKVDNERESSRLSPNEARPCAGPSRSPPRPRRGAQRASPSRWRRRPGRAAGTASGRRGASQDGSGAAGSAVRDGAVSECARSPRPPPAAHIQPLGESWPGHWVGRKPPNRGNRGPRVRTRTHSGTRTWCRVRQWRRITASVRRATVHAAFSRAPRRPPATAPRRVRPRDAMDLRILCSWGGKGGNRGLGQERCGEASRRARMGSCPRTFWAPQEAPARLRPRRAGGLVWFV